METDWKNEVPGDLGAGHEHPKLQFFTVLIEASNTSLTTHTTRTSFHSSSSFYVFGSSSQAGVTIRNKVILWTTILRLVLNFFPQKIQLNQRPI